jgi:NADH-quinone oxidoreductase subunit N
MTLPVLAQTGLPGTGTTVPSEAPVQVPTPTVDWSALLPLVILMVGALLLLTITSLVKRRSLGSFYAVYTIAVASAAIVAVLPVWARVQGWSKLLWIDQSHPDGTGAFTTVGGAIGIDGFGLFVTIVILAAVVIGALLADDYLRREGLEGPELYVLMMLSAAGGLMMAMADDLIVLFLGLETLSIAVYVLAAMHRKRAQSQEAGLKYFVLGSFSSAFLLYGIAFVYGATGSTNLIAIKDFMAEVVPVENALLLMGFGFLLVGLGFKVAAVPFHAWSPDVYDGAPTPVVAFMAAAVKAAAFAGMVRVFMLTFDNYEADWKPVIWLLAILSMVGGALLGTVQSNVKRMLAYSSINHAGFILIAVAAVEEGQVAVQAVLFYLVAYTFMVAGSFGVVTVVGRRGDGHHELHDYRGLARGNPTLALVFTVFLLAQAGVPFTSGFFAKFYAVTASVDAGAWWLALLAMITAVIAAFVYLRIVITMYMSGAEDGADEEPAPVRVRVPAPAGLAIAVCFAVTMVVGILPSTVLDAAGQARPELVRVEEPDTGLTGAATAGATESSGASPAGSDRAGG